MIRTNHPPCRSKTEGAVYSMRLQRPSAARRMVEMMDEFGIDTSTVSATTS